ncbi:MAG: trypsin-like peptidase domain-containing protein [Candidatus Sumerlaeia bacterium]|nr:trypsin-like peptidase domain-containing protein [Candidatus Sumerlaeia bacterium]
MANNLQVRLYRIGLCVSLVMIGLLLGLLIRHEFLDARKIADRAEAASIRPANARPAVLDGYQKERTRVMEVVEAVSPSVVTVGAVKREVVNQPWIESFHFPLFLREERTRRLPYLGSGFLIDEDGHVVTNHHVIENSISIFVTFPDGREFPATLIDADKYVDLALLKLETNGKSLPPPLEFGDSESLLIGEQVMAFGNPFGNLIEDSQPTVTVGHISALNRDFRPDSRTRRVYQGMIQTDSAINPGNSGGPLIDTAGRVVGVNSFIFSPSGGNTGISFALPANRVRSFVEEIRTFGRLRPLLLDFEVQTLRSRRMAGVMVVAMQAEGHAWEAGLRLGDVVVALDGKPVQTRDAFRVFFASRQIGDKVTLRVYRDGNFEELVYTVKEAQV